MSVSANHLKAPAPSSLAVVARDTNPRLAFALASGEHRLDPASTVVELVVQVQRCVDVREVAERLREVAQLFACEPYLLGIETEVVGVRGSSSQGSASPPRADPSEPARQRTRTCRWRRSPLCHVTHRAKRSDRSGRRGYRRPAPDP